MLKYRLHQGITTISCLLPPSEIIFYVSTHSGLQEFLPPPCNLHPPKHLQLFKILLQTFPTLLQLLKKVEEENVL